VIERVSRSLNEAPDVLAELRAENKQQQARIEELEGAGRELAEAYAVWRVLTNVARLPGVHPAAYTGAEQALADALKPF
jgi:hypothetical protein